MRTSWFRSSILLGISTLILSACSTAPPTGSSKAVAPSQKSMAESIKAEQKSIAITNIYYKKKGENLQYVEEVSNQFDSSESARVATEQNKTAGQVSKMNELADPFANSQTTAFPIKFTNLADFKPAQPGEVLGQDKALKIESTPSPVKPSTTSVNTQQVKKTGYESQAEYGQLRSFSAAIRGLLLKNGYKVVQANISALKPSQGDEFFNIIERIKAGDFNGADYVMVGILGEMSFTDNVDSIVGTKSTSQQIGLDLIVDFSIIDTKTYQVLASFLAEGNGKEVRIDGRDYGSKASMAKLTKQAADKLAQDVANHLADQDFVSPYAPNLTVKRNFKTRIEDDSSTLKIYTK